MNKMILQVVDSVSHEKDLDSELIFEAIEVALATVTAKSFAEEVSIRVAIDRETGASTTYRYWTVVADDAEEIILSKDLPLSQAKETDADLDIDDVVEEEIESAQFGRIAAQQAKQVIVQKVREAERNKIEDRYRDRINELVIGVVKKATRDSIILDLGDNAEGMIPREEMIPREMPRMGDRLRGLFCSVREEKRGPQLLISRTRPQMLIELFKIEVPEIGEQVIEIKAAARDPGSRAKIAVKTNDGRIDPIGACVGMRGSRVQAVSSELGGERIDIVLWDDDPAQLVINAMAPAEVSSIVADIENKKMDIIVEDEQLSQAIGRNGQNVRLASELTGWTLNVMSEKDAEEKSEHESGRLVDIFKQRLEVDDNIAEVLVREGFTNIEEVAYFDENEMQAIPEFDETLVEELRTRARDVLLTQALMGSEIDVEPDDDLLELEGMTKELAYALADRGIVTREDLAEQSVDEIYEIENIGNELAGKLIMEARAPWFESSNSE